MEVQEYNVGSRRICKDKTLGYQYFCDKSHPLSDKKGRVWFHRHVMSVKLGRWVLDHEIVHHIDGKRDNNEENNLLIMLRDEHARHHEKVLTDVKCHYCGSNFTPDKRTRIYCGKKCYNLSKLKIDWPDIKTLLDMVKKSSYTEVGRYLGVSDTAIRKRIHCATRA